MIPPRPNPLEQVPVRNRPSPEAARPIPTPAAAESFDVHNPTRVLAFGMGLCLVLTRFGMLHFAQTFLMGVNLRLLYLFGIPALLGVLLSRGIQRSFRGRPAYYYTGYLLWIGLAVPFSSWRSDSLRLFITYARTEFIMLLVIAGLTITWRECRLMMCAIAWGGVFSVGMAKMFQSQNVLYQERLGLQFGTMANPNDYAGHLLLVLPFVLWIVLSSKTPAIRLGALLIVALGTWKILQTGSRGAAIGLAAAILVFLWRGTARQRITLLAIIPLMAVGLVAVLPGSLVQRLHSFSSGGDSSAEALESSQTRVYLLKKSVEYTLTHPIFGVGPGQFASYEGQHNIVVGTHGSWHDTHNMFTQVSSECGIPAFFLFTAALVSTWRLLSGAYRKARQRADCADIQTAVLCVMIGMAGFCVAATFLNFAYFFYQPALGGLAIAISTAASQECERRSAGAPAAKAEPPAWLRFSARLRSPGSKPLRQEP